MNSVPVPAVLLLDVQGGRLHPHRSGLLVNFSVCRPAKAITQAQFHGPRSRIRQFPFAIPIRLEGIAGCLASLGCFRGFGFECIGTLPQLSEFRLQLHGGAPTLALVFITWANTAAGLPQRQH
jgi:hypothetical protein